MAIHSSTLAWKIPWTEEPGSPWGLKESDMTELLHFHFLSQSFSNAPVEDTRGNHSELVVCVQSWSSAETHFFFFFRYYCIHIYLLTLQYCIGFAIHQNDYTTGVHVLTILTTPPDLPPRTIPLGHPSAPAPSILNPATNLDWRFVSYMILYMFQCHSPQSSHPLPLPLPQSPKDCSLHLCLFCCLTYRVIVIIFLNSTYMH